MKVFLTLRRIFLESIGGRPPLFKSMLELGTAVAGVMPGPKYTDPKSLASYFSQVANGTRPLPDGLATGLQNSILSRARERGWTAKEMSQLEEVLNRLSFISFKKRQLPEVLPNHLKAVADISSPNKDMLPFLREVEAKLGIPLSVESCKALLNDWEEYYSIELEVTASET